MSKFAELSPLSEGEYLHVQETLLAFQEPNIGRVMNNAVHAGARSLIDPLRAAAPVKKASSGGISGTTKRGVVYGNPGDLRDSIASNSDSGRPGTRVGPMGPKAFARAWVIRGTKEHDITANKGHGLRLPWGVVDQVHVRGSKPNPFVARVAAAEGGIMLAGMAKSIARAAKKEGVV